MTARGKPPYKTLRASNNSGVFVGIIPARNSPALLQTFTPTHHPASQGAEKALVGFRSWWLVGIMFGLSISLGELDFLLAPPCLYQVIFVPITVHLYLPLFNKPFGLHFRQTLVKIRIAGLIY
jgi:hypothetical protein